MLFNSYEFLFAFLPITLAGFFLVAAAGHRSLAIGWLVAASLFFYGWWNPAFLGLLGFSVLFNYGLGLVLERARGGGESRLTAILAAGVAVNLGLIAYFKYAGFLADAVNRAFGAAIELGDVTLPLAISFFTFQQIAYLADVRRGVACEHRLLRYSLFVVFFPQLIAGPIVHHTEVLPQFARDETFRPSAANLAVGLTIFAIGLFKKVVIADAMAAIATPAFAAAHDGAHVNFVQAWSGAFAYSLQIYFDFSGYSDMAIGLGRLFGIRLPLNFAAPYRAASIIEFWRCWHMTLSRFLRDYLYIPLGGNRHGRVRRHLNIMATMLLGGLWHGAGWTFVVWGGVHGLLLVANHGWRAMFPRAIDRWWSRLAGRTVTFMAVTLAWVFFRSETFGDATVMFAGMIDLPRTWTDGDINDGLWLLFWIVFLWTMPTTQELMARFRPALGFPGPMATRRARPALLRLLPGLHWRPSAVWAGATAGIVLVALLHLTRVSEFLYFRF